MIDIGANLADASFDPDRPAVLERAWAAGIEHIVLTGSSQLSNRRVQEIRDQAPEHLSATAGLHPHYASQWTDALAGEIRAYAAANKLVAVGECGLDYFRDLSDRADQRRAFIAQLEIAADTGLPVFLHQREAHADFVAIVREFRDQLTDCVVHCFTDTAQALDDYLALDCHIGITGWICDERRGTHLLDCVGRIPTQRLMVETDAPYLLPRTLRPRPKSRRNEPMHLPRVIDTLAAAVGLSEKALAEATTRTARLFFRLPSAADQRIERSRKPTSEATTSVGRKAVSAGDKP